MDTKIVYFLLLLLIPDHAIAQNHKIDSLKIRLLHSELTDAESFDVLLELGRRYGDVDNGTSLKFANEALKLAKASRDSLKIVKANRLKAQLLRRFGSIDSALILFNNALEISRRNRYRNEEKMVLNGLGTAYLVNGKFDEALKFFFETLELHEKDANHDGIAISLHNIGLTYYKLEDYDRALTFYERELKIKDEAHINGSYTNTLCDISLCYAYKNDFARAKFYVTRVFLRCGDGCSEGSLIGAHFSLGLLSYNQGQFDEAEMHFRKSLTLSKKNGDGRLLMDNVNYLIRIYIANNELNLAEAILRENEQSIDSSLAYNDTVIELYTQVIKLFSKANNFERIAFYQAKYISLNDSVYSRNLTTNLMKIEAEHVEKESKAKIKSQAKILELNKQIISRQMYLNVVIGVVAVLLIAFAIVLVKINRHKQRLNYLLDRRVKERTEDLKLNHDFLQRACEERDIVMNKAATDIRSSFATIKGLCYLGMKDSHDNRCYFEQLNMASDNLLQIIGNLIYRRSPPQ